jgi:RNA polymerase sigma factor (sigma-70 family)
MISRALGEPLARPVVWTGSPEFQIGAVADSDSASTEDGKLLAPLQPRYPGDLDVLFDQYSRLVLGIACRVLGDPNEAEDIVQEVFFYLYRRPEVFNPSKGSLKTWIIQITSSRALDRKLYLARRGFYAEEDIDSLQLRGEIDLEQHVDAKLSRKYLQRAFLEKIAEGGTNPRLSPYLIE